MQCNVLTMTGIPDKMWIKCWQINLKYWLKARGFKVHNISLRKIKPTKKLCDAKTAQVTHLTTSKTKSLPAMLRQPRERCHLWNSAGCETMWVSSQHGLAFLPISSPNKALYSNSKLYWKQNAAMTDGRQWTPDLLWSDFTLKYNIHLNNDVLFQVQRLMSNTELYEHTLLQSSLSSSSAHHQQREMSYTLYIWKHSLTQCYKKRASSAVV